MPHRLTRVWLREGVPTPAPKGFDEFMMGFRERTPESTFKDAIDAIELHGDCVVLTDGGRSRAVPLANVRAYEPPRACEPLEEALNRKERRARETQA